MKRSLLLSALVLSLVVTGAAQPAPQNAREALLEMFFGKPGSFEKHLPRATRAALQEVSGGDTTMLQQLSMVTGLMKAQGRLETFEAGPTLLAFEDPVKHARFEVVVKEDNLRGDEDEIVVAFAAYKDGQVQNLEVSPQLSFLMKSEEDVWRLNELSVTIHLPLANPDFLKGVVQGIKQRQALRASAAGMPVASEGASSWQSSPNEPSAIASMRTILTAEITYASQYPTQGFTCSLSDLDGFGQGTPNEHQAMLIESRLASGKKNGYVFTLSQCGVAPAKHFVLTGVPSIPGAGRTFCADESGTVKSFEGAARDCVANGKAVQ
jgi:hypothetical protein